MRPSLGTPLANPSYGQPGDPECAPKARGPDILINL
jgi:hypothetical protein